MPRKSAPYVMRPRAKLPPRPTADDAPDRRVPQINPRRLNPTEIRILTRPGTTDPRLRPADRWLERWAATHGSGPILPYAATVDMGATRSVPRVPELDDRESLLIDEIVASSHLWARSFVMLWYRTYCTVQDIADHLRMKRRQAVYEERSMVLAYYTRALGDVGLNVTAVVDTVRTFPVKTR